MRNPSRLAVLAVGLVVWSACTANTGRIGSSGARRGAWRPNVLFILTDQLPVSSLGAYGNPLVRTPSIDRIAHEGIRFDRFHIAAFSCSPSRASFLTGRYAHNHGVVLNDIPLAKTFQTLGTLFKRAGYQTAHIGKWHLGGQMARRADAPGYSAELVPNPRAFFAANTAPWRGGEDRPQGGFTAKWVGGWAHYQSYLQDVGLPYRGIGVHNDNPSGREGTHIYSLLSEEHHMSAFLAGEAEKFIRQERKRRRPFCMVLSFYGPHAPVAPPQPWDSMLDPVTVPLPANHDDPFAEQPPGRDRMKCCLKREWSAAQFRDYVARFWGYASYIDAQIGRVLRALDDTGLTDETIIVFASDHGDLAASHGSILKYASGYDELMRVPLAVRYPSRVAGGSTSQALISSVDLLPTLLSLAGIGPPGGIDGRSFVPVLERPDQPFREVVLTQALHSLTARRDDWKLVLNRPGHLARTQQPFLELYDMRDQPLEIDNRAGDPDAEAVLAQLKDDMVSWAIETGHPHVDAYIAELASAQVSR